MQNDNKEELKEKTPQPVPEEKKLKEETPQPEKKEQKLTKADKRRIQRKEEQAQEEEDLRKKTNSLEEVKQARRLEKVRALRMIMTSLEDHEYKGELNHTVVCQDGKIKHVTTGAAQAHGEIQKTLNKGVRLRPGFKLISTSENDKNISEELVEETFKYILEALQSKTTHTFLHFFNERDPTTSKLYFDIIQIVNLHFQAKKIVGGYEEADLPLFLRNPQNNSSK